MAGEALALVFVVVVVVGGLVGRACGDGVSRRRRGRRYRTTAAEGCHAVEGGVEEDVAVPRVVGEEGEGGVPRRHDGDGPVDAHDPVEVCEVLPSAQRLELRLDRGQELFPVRLEIYQQHQRARGVGVEDAIPGRVEEGVEVGDRVLFLQDVQQGVDVQRSKRPIRRQRRHGMSDVEFVLEQPDVRLHARAADSDRRVQGLFAPVVVVGMTCHRPDVGGEVSGPVDESFVDMTRATGPGLAERPLEVVGKEGFEQAEAQDEQLD